MKTSLIIIIVCNLIAWTLMIPISQFIDTKVENRRKSDGLKFLIGFILLFLLFTISDCLGYSL